MNDKRLQDVQNDTEEKFVLLKSDSLKELVCPECSSSSYRKKGFLSEKQRYKCLNCGCYFLENNKKNEIKYPDKFDFDSDIWLDEHLGLKRYPYQTGGKILNFSAVHPDWLKYYAKRFVWYFASTKSWRTLIGHLQNLNCFSKFLDEIKFTGYFPDIDRELIIDYLSYLGRKNLSPESRLHRLYTLSLFFETGFTNNWFQIQPHLIRQEDYPKRNKTLPRYIPEEVMLALNQNLDKLPESIMRMVLVLQETGLRIGELCQLPLNCLKSDGKGHYYIKFMRVKFSKEDMIPISEELAAVIKEQQQYIHEHLVENFEYLFCTRRKNSYEFQPVAKIIKDVSFIKYLKRLAKECQIKDNSGKLWNFQSHQFRHTVGTRMINAGVPQHIIQRYLGHESPTMTAVYAHIHDETLRREIEKYHESRVVNFRGETVELEETILSSNDDLDWFKKNVQVRALEHGYCARPKVLGNCDIPGFDGCYDCPHWRTNKTFLPILKDTLERTNKVIEKARNCGWELQVKKNEPIKHNLEKVIKSLEVEDNE